MRFPIGLLIPLIALLTGCSQAAVATPRPISITIAGATSMHPVLQELTDAFNQRHPNVLFDIRGGGSRLGEEQVANGRINLGASTFLPAQEGEDTGSSVNQDQLVRIPIGIDGVVLVVHASNPVENLTEEQIRDVFNGRILDWAELNEDATSSENEDEASTGGMELGEVVLISREDGSGARRLFEENIMEDKSVSLTAVVMPTSRDVLAYVAKQPAAVGYVSHSYFAETGNTSATPSPVPTFTPAPLVVTPVVATPTLPAPAPTPTDLRDAVRVVAIDGGLPTDQTLGDQTYALIQPLYLMSLGEPSGWVAEFIDFVLSPAGQTIIDRYHRRVR